MYVRTIGQSGWKPQGRGTKYTKLNRYERVKRHRLSVYQEVMKTITFEEEGEQTKDMEMYTKEECLQLKDELHSSKVEADSL